MLTLKGCQITHVTTCVLDNAMTYLHGFLLCEPSVNAAEYANGSRHTMVIGPFDVHPPKWVYKVYKAYEKGVGMRCSRSVGERSFPAHSDKRNLLGHGRRELCSAMLYARTQADPRVLRRCPSVSCYLGSTKRTVPNQAPLAGFDLSGVETSRN